ncbi:flagellar hook-length control protein FliK [Stenotrophomonas sp.]|uniref:flagellar hook-length control protein FliK n=1 Tax=Stenotrophomonas sp. TaxID=69392 RepID=UPI002D5B3E74|nr:flagellar hook-length control protein FliK [Stenotrophomonas sp.]HYQ23339.1 flagellar hook-length control protein FliK [Stenotrophomonas sp.]
MPSALSSSVGTSASASASSAPTGSPRSSGSGKDFGQMLQGPAQKDTPAGTKVTPSAPGTASNSASATADGSTDTPAGTATDSEDGATETAAATPTVPTTAEDKDTASDADDAPWPPPGLAGLVLAAPVAIDPVATAPVVSANGGDTAAAAATPALPTSALPATAAPLAATPVTTSAVATTSEGEMSTQPLPAMILGQQALDGADDSDTLAVGDRTPPAPLQSPLPAALQDLKAALASTAVFSGEPTPTPTVGDDGFDQAIGARLGWLADQKIGHAHIRLNPEDLGPVDVRLQMTGDKVHASFSSPHVDVRQALESSLPRLRELLGEQGFQLAHADVGQQHSGDGGPSGQPAGAGNGIGGGDGEPSRADTSVSAAQLIRQRGLLDAYA